MPRRRYGLNGGAQVEGDFVEADLDTAYALLYVAEVQSLSGDDAGALHAIDDADEAITDGLRRLTTLSAADCDRFRPQFERMKIVVSGVRQRISGT